MNINRSTELTFNSDAESVHRSLLKLGLPQHVTLEEFQRLYRGTLGDALLLISEHLKGRQEVADARNRIQWSRVSKSKSLMKQPEILSTARSSEDVAASRLRKAKKDMEVYGQELKEQLNVVESLEQEISDLKRQVEAKRRVSMMLEALKDKEGERLRRFEEINALLKELNGKARPKETMEIHTYTSPNECQDATAMQHISSLLRSSRTRDVLANLEAYHIRLSRIAQHDTSTDLLGLKTELKKLVASKLGTRNLQDPEVVKVFDAFVKAARSRAQHAVGYQPYAETRRPVRITTKQLQALALEDKRKEKALQDRADLSMGLAVTSAYMVDSSVAFQKTSVPSLQNFLEEQSRAIRGHINVMRYHVLQEGREEKDAKSETFEREVKRILGVGRAATQEKVLEEIERLFRRAHQKREHYKAVNIPSPPPPTDKELTILASFDTTTKEVEAKTVKLLTRKIAKAKLGNGLVKDVETLLKEMEVIIGHGGAKRS